MKARSIALAGGVTAVAVAAGLGWADAAITPFGVAPPPEQGGSPLTAGPLAPLFLWIAFAQQHFYGDLVARMSDLKENPWALWALLGLAFVYGVFHAAGPGHGKAVISGYLMATGESVKRGILLSFAAAFVQALSAVLVVAIAGAILHVTAVTMSAATSWFEVASSGLIAAVGAWLLWSKTFGSHSHAHFHAPLPASVGAASVRELSVHDHHHEDDHDHAANVHRHDGHDHLDEAGHDHEYAALAHAAVAPGRSPLMRAWSAIFAVGIRPCSGALIVLVFSLAQGVFLAGIAATFVMAIGTGVTVAILATLAVTARGIALRLAGADSPRTERLVRWAEIGVAAAVFVFGLLLLGGSLVNGVAGA